MKPQSQVTKNRKFRQNVFWTYQNQGKSRKSRFSSKTMYEDFSRGLGEQLCTNCQMLQSQFKARTKVNNTEKGKTNLNIHSECLHENCTNCQKLQYWFKTRTKVTKQSSKARTNLHDKCTGNVKLKVQGEMPLERFMKESTLIEHKLRVGNSVDQNSNEQGLQQLFQIGINLTKSSHKLRTNFLEVNYSRPLLEAKQIPFKMKRLVTVNFWKPNVRMKDSRNQNNFGKLRWKFKNGIQSPKNPSVKG
jgi:hypothetical protein